MYCKQLQHYPISIKIKAEASSKGRLSAGSAYSILRSFQNRSVLNHLPSLPCISTLNVKPQSKDGEFDFTSMISDVLEATRMRLQEIITNTIFSS